MWKDRVFKAREKREHAEKEQAIRDEEDRASGNTMGILSLSGNAGAVAVHGGY